MDNTVLVWGKYVIKDDKEIIKRGAVYVEDGKIEEIGKFEELYKSHPSVEVVGGETQIVMPGLVNSHSHGKGVSAFQMGVKDEPLELWLPSYFERTCNCFLHVYLNTLLFAMKQIKNGVTTALHHHCGLLPSKEYQKEYKKEIENSIRAYQDIGMRVAFAPYVWDENIYAFGTRGESPLESISCPEFLSLLPKKLKEMLRFPDFEDVRRGYFDTFSLLHRKYEKEDNVKLVLGPSAPQWASTGLLEQIRDTSERLKVGIHTHLLESKYMKYYGLETRNKSDVEYLYDLGLLTRVLSCAHSVWLTEKDIELLKETGTSIVHNPSSNLHLFNGIIPLIPLIKNGIDVGIGMDDMGLNDDGDLFQELRLCTLLHRPPSITSKEISSGKILNMATKNGGKISNFNDIGTLAVEKKGDIITLNTERIFSPYIRPGHNLLDILVYRAKGLDVDNVIIGGRVIMKEREFTEINRNKILSEAREQLSSMYGKYDMDNDENIVSKLKPYIEKYCLSIERRRKAPFYYFNEKY